MELQRVGHRSVGPSYPELVHAVALTFRQIHLLTLRTLRTGHAVPIPLPGKVADCGINLVNCFVQSHCQFIVHNRHQESHLD